MSNSAVTLTEVRYTCATTRLTGFAASDPTVQGLRPGVLIVHDAWGVGDHVKMRARMLADLGYVALAIDLYGEGVKPRSLDEARALVEQFTANPELLRARAGAGLEALRTQPGVDASRIAIIGYCFGGMTVLEMARGGARCAVAASFHGLLKTRLPAATGTIQPKLLVCTGSEDPLVPLDDVREFQLEMRAAAADCQTVIYNGARHGFANPFSTDNPAIAHHPVADRRSWRAMLDLFDEAFATAG